jgi:hypothetical protein
VNGDDAVLKTNKKGCKTHDIIATFMGLNKSVGKVYESNQFLNANSTTFTYNKDGYYSQIKDKNNRAIRRTICYKEIKYVNMGLVSGQKRSGGTEIINSKTGEINLGPICTELIRACPEELRSIVMKKFVMKHLEFLKNAEVPWFLPQNLGGLGLPEVEDHRTTTLQLRMLRTVVENPKIYQIPVPPTQSVWLTWKLAQQTLSKYKTLEHPDLRFLDYSGENSISADKVISLRGIAALFDDKLYDKLVDEKVLTMKPDKKVAVANKQHLDYIKRLRKFWKSVTKGLQKVPLRESYSNNILPKFYKINKLPLYKLYTQSSLHIKQLQTSEETLPYSTNPSSIDFENVGQWQGIYEYSEEMLW